MFKLRKTVIIIELKINEVDIDANNLIHTNLFIMKDGGIITTTS